MALNYVFLSGESNLQCLHIITKDKGRSINKGKLPRRCIRGASIKGYCATHAMIIRHGKFTNRTNVN